MNPDPTVPPGFLDHKIVFKICDYDLRELPADSCSYPYNKKYLTDSARTLIQIFTAKIQELNKTGQCSQAWRIVNEETARAQKAKVCFLINHSVCRSMTARFLENALEADITRRELGSHVILIGCVPDSLQ